MPASPADIAKYTTDGVVLSAPSDAAGAAIKAAHVDAIDASTNEIEMFFDDPDDAQDLLDERATYLTRVNPLHLGIEVDDGASLPWFSGVNVSTYTVKDEVSGTTKDCRLRAFAIDTGADRYSFEVLE